jgi:hypothetical protein
MRRSRLPDGTWDARMVPLGSRDEHKTLRQKEKREELLKMYSVRSRFQ